MGTKDIGWKNTPWYTWSVFTSVLSVPCFTWFSVLWSDLCKTEGITWREQSWIKTLEFLPNWKRKKKKKKEKKGKKTSSQANSIQIPFYFCVLCYIKFILWLICNEVGWIMQICITNLSVHKKSLMKDGITKTEPCHLQKGWWYNPEWGSPKASSLQLCWAGGSSSEVVLSSPEHPSPAGTAQPFVSKPAKMSWEHSSEHRRVWSSCLQETPTCGWAKRSPRKSWEISALP